MSVVRDRRELDSPSRSALGKLEHKYLQPPFSLRPFPCDIERMGTTAFGVRIDLPIFRMNEWGIRGGAVTGSVI